MSEAGTRIVPKYDKPKGPNILWICTDQQRWDSLGCYGNEFVKTPNIDKLASEGVLFEHAFSQSSICTPSRGSFLTGRYPSTNRLRQNGQRCPEDLRLLPRMLKDKGYVTGLSGKLHLSNCDERIGLVGSKDEWWKYDNRYFFNGMEKRIDDGYDEFYWNHAPGTGEAQNASDYTMWVHEKGGKIQFSSREDSKVVKQGMPDELHQTTWACDRAINFMERHADAHYPWMFSLNIFDPHPHFDPEPSFFEPYLDKIDEIPLPAYVDGENDTKPKHHRDGQKGITHMDDREKRMMVAAYWAMCDHIDHHVGRVMKALEQSGQRENTIVIFMSDHGELLGDHDRSPKGPFLYDCSVRVPLMVSWPGKFEAGKRAKGLVELTDIVPTLNDILALGEEVGLQGVSVKDVLDGTSDGEHIRDEAYCEFHNGHGRNRPFLTMVRTHTHKLIVAHQTSDGELYDLEKDPGEHINRWADPAYVDVKVDLLVRCTNRLAFTCDPLPARVGIY